LKTSHVPPNRLVGKLRPQPARDRREVWSCTILEGSVRRDTNRVRIVAQLVDAATDEHIWSETYDRDLTDIFAIQTDVALNIANALRAELSKDERTRVNRWPTYNLDAYDMYLRGRHWFYRFTEEGFRRSIVALDGAIALDPRFARAWAGIAETHAEFCIEGFVGSSPEESIMQAKAAVGRALEIDQELAEAHGILGLIRFVFDFDWAGAEREFLKAIELCPGSAEVHDHYSWLCASLERYDDAMRSRCTAELCVSVRKHPDFRIKHAAKMIPAPKFLLQRSTLQDQCCCVESRAASQWPIEVCEDRAEEGLVGNS
jgi:hypothetical protein